MKLAATNYPDYFSIFCCLRRCVEIQVMSSPHHTSCYSEIRDVSSKSCIIFSPHIFLHSKYDFKSLSHICKSLTVPFLLLISKYASEKIKFHKKVLVTIPGR